MKRLPVRTVPFVIASLLLPPTALATLPLAAVAGPNSNATILLHLASPTTKSIGTRAEAHPACADVVTHGSLYPQFYFAYLLVADGDATAVIAGLACGISYGSGGSDRVGVDILSWSPCVAGQPQPPDYGPPRWGDSGSGTIITWDYTNACQRSEPGGAGTGVVATAGYFYLTAYSDAVLSITPRPVDNLAQVASCSAGADTLERGC